MAETALPTYSETAAPQYLPPNEALAKLVPWIEENYPALLRIFKTATCDPAKMVLQLQVPEAEAPIYEKYREPILLYFRQLTGQKFFFEKNNPAASQESTSENKQEIIITTSEKWRLLRQQFPQLEELRKRLNLEL